MPTTPFGVHWRRPACWSRTEGGRRAQRRANAPRRGHRNSEGTGDADPHVGSLSAVGAGCRLCPGLNPGFPPAGEPVSGPGSHLPAHLRTEGRYPDRLGRPSGPLPGATDPGGSRSDPGAQHPDRRGPGLPERLRPDRLQLGREHAEGVDAESEELPVGVSQHSDPGLGEFLPWTG